MTNTEQRPGPAMVWDYIHAMRLFAIDVIEDRDVATSQMDRGKDGTIEDSWAQWDDYTDINFWIDEVDVSEHADQTRIYTQRVQRVTAYLHPTGDGTVKYTCGQNLDDRCRIELYREQI